MADERRWTVTGEAKKSLKADPDTAISFDSVSQSPPYGPRIA